MVTKRNGENRDRNGHVLVWEQPGIQDENTDCYVERRKGWLGARHVMTFMLFLGMANAYVMRTNMSVAIVAMVNHSAIVENVTLDDECFDSDNPKNLTDPVEHDTMQDGDFIWETDLQAIILSSFFYGYVITQVPFGVLAKRYGNLYFLGVGMLINSVFGLLVPISANYGHGWLMAVRFIQGLGEGPIVPCTHALLAKWIPPNERSRMGAFVYAGAQFGTVVSMPLSGLLASSSWKWPSIFYTFGLIGTVWSLAFLYFCYESPDTHPKIQEEEKKYIMRSLGTISGHSFKVPWKSIATSLPFYGILFAHMGQNFGYETLMTELPTFMKQVLHFNLKDNGTLSALPYVAMWLLSIVISQIADYLLIKKNMRIEVVRKISNAIGQFGPAIALVMASYTGCNPALTVAILTVGFGLNSGIYSGFKVNHLDISPSFAGLLMSFTNCSANMAGLLAPLTAGYIIKGKPTQAQWRKVFFISAGIYVVCCSMFILLAKGTRQPWDPAIPNENENENEKEKDKTKEKHKENENLQVTTQ